MLCIIETIIVQILHLGKRNVNILLEIFLHGWNVNYIEVTRSTN